MKSLLKHFKGPSHGIFFSESGPTSALSRTILNLRYAKVFLVETSGVKEKCHQSFSTFLGSCICSTTCKSVLAGALSNWSLHWQNILFNLTFKRFTEIEEFFIAGLPLWVPLRSGSCSPFFSFISSSSFSLCVCRVYFSSSCAISILFRRQQSSIKVKWSGLKRRKFIGILKRV